MKELKAVFHLVDECFVVHDIKIIEDNEGIFISMPSRKTQMANTRHCSLINTPTREMIRQAILAEYNKNLQKKTHNA